MEEDIKNDLAGIAYTHPYFSEIVNNALEYIEKLEKENKNYKKYAVMMSTDGLLINGVRFSFNDYIPISVIQNKKTKLNEEDLEIYDTDSEDVRIAKQEQRAILDFCNSLLEERNK